jgi:hypothetical protein
MVDEYIAQEKVHDSGDDSSDPDYFTKEMKCVCIALKSADSF